MRIPTKKITRSEPKTIRASPTGAVISSVRPMIVMRQGKGRDAFVNLIWPTLMLSFGPPVSCFPYRPQPMIGGWVKMDPK